jgi:integrase
MLDHMSQNKKATTILTNSRGKSWTEDGFRASWGKALRRSGITALHFHDLRGTAVTRLALADCTPPQIASITGHSLKDVESILDTHYLGGRIELAEIAMGKLERHEDRTNSANQVQTADDLSSPANMPKQISK